MLGLGLKRFEIKAQWMRTVISVCAPAMIILLVYTSRLNTKIPDPWMIFKILASSLGVVICAIALIFAIIWLIFRARPKE